MASKARCAATSALLLTAALGGCAETSAGDPDRVVARDSAGITIVENRGPAWSDASAWALGSEPTLEVVGDDAGLSFFNIVFAAELSDGGLVVVNAGSRTIHWLDATGAHLESTGGAGEGPGEFRGITWAELTASDSLYVWDGQARRMSVYADQEFVRSFGVEVPAPWGSVSIGGLLADGSVVAMATPLPGGDGREGLVRPEVPAWILTPEGSLSATLGSFPSAAIDFRAGAGPGSVIRRVVPFGPRTVIGAGGDRAVVGNSEVYEVAIHGSEGSLERLVRVPSEAVRVGAAQLEAELERRLVAAPPIEEIRDGIRATFEATPVPDFMPEFEELRIDPDGYVWVRRAGIEAPGDGVRWDVLDMNGEWLGTLRVPAGLRITQITTGSVLGVWTDELGVESIRALPLDRSGG